MAVIKDVVQAGNPLLRERAKEVPNINEEVQSIIKDLVDTMRANHLVGSSAPQIGHSLRMFVSEIRDTKYREGEEENSLRIYINPKVLEISKEEHIGYEGCGSVADANFFAPVKRSKWIRIKAYDENNKPFTLKADGLLGRVILHEIDHLNGILFTDKIDDWKKVMSRNEYIKMKRDKKKKKN